MDVEGGCYCGEVRYKSSGDPVFKGQCHCRECQYMAGGQPNTVMGMPGDGFELTKGETKSFTRTDIDNPVTREFCANCGTHVMTLAKSLPGVMLLKVGTLDDPAQFGKPEMAIWTSEAQSFHTVPEGIPTFEKGPGS